MDMQCQEGGTQDFISGEESWNHPNVPLTPF